MALPVRETIGAILFITFCSQLTEDQKELHLVGQHLHGELQGAVLAVVVAHHALGMDNVLKIVDIMGLEAINDAIAQPLVKEAAVFTVQGHGDDLIVSVLHAVEGDADVLRRRLAKDGP